VSHKLSSFQGDLILKPNEYAIIAQDAKKFLEKYEASSNITVIDSSWGSLKEKGERIALKDGGFYLSFLLKLFFRKNKS